MIKIWTRNPNQTLKKAEFWQKNDKNRFWKDPIFTPENSWEFKVILFSKMTKYR